MIANGGCLEVKRLRQFKTSTRFPDLSHVLFKLGRGEHVDKEDITPRREGGSDVIDPLIEMVKIVIPLLSPPAHHDLPRSFELIIPRAGAVFGRRRCLSMWVGEALIVGRGEIRHRCLTREDNDVTGLNFLFRVERKTRARLGAGRDPRDADDDGVLVDGIALANRFADEVSRKFLSIPRQAAELASWQGTRRNGAGGGWTSTGRQRTAVPSKFRSSRRTFASPGCWAHEKSNELIKTDKSSGTTIS